MELRIRILIQIKSFTFPNFPPFIHLTFVICISPFGLLHFQIVAHLCCGSHRSEWLLMPVDKNQNQRFGAPGAFH